MPDEEKSLIDEEEEEVAEESAKPGILTFIKTKLTKILGYSILAVLIILISVGISYLVSSHVNKDKIREIGGKIQIPPPAPYESVDFGEFTINIRGDDEEPHFIRVNVILAYAERQLTLAAEISKRRPQISDLINIVLSGKSKSDLDSPEGKRNLKIEIREEINQRLQSGKIQDVYFKSITVM
ncbi:MAG: flagellar basal body-associated FliL family protein [Spirochaetes bacterium]|nr:flagellar basal body-associated FliL family protein [Spirochaetota bacterium]